jgi:hypothetical protein
VLFTSVVTKDVNTAFCSSLVTAFSSLANMPVIAMFVPAMGGLESFVLKCCGLQVNWLNEGNPAKKDMD